MDLDYDREEESTEEEPELQPTPSVERRREDGGRRFLLWVLFVVAAIGGGLAYWYLRPEPAPPPVPEERERPEATAPAPEPRPEPVEEAEEEMEIPPLEESDEVVRRLVREVSSHPDLTRWLATDRLIERFVAVVDNVAEGVDPRRHLPVRRLEEPFVPEEGGDEVRISARSYARYDDLVGLFTSLDPDGVARLYERLEPRIREAYRRLGYPYRDFEDALVEAFREIQETPIPESPPTLTPRVRGWEYEDPRLEELAPVQKALIRMGPENARAVKSH
ncbi:MAG: DUF3014 domain-containing protein, partial [Thermoanaerobaculia bacterium]|nr:DUF3014 domain-containing protein [Thermoanaerobaculia bacterium]